MPVVNVELDWLNQLLGQELRHEEVRQTLDQLGCDVEEIVEIARCRCPACGALVEGSLGVVDVKRCPFCGYQGEEAFQEVDELVVIRLDLLAARPDLFDVGGLARALRGAMELSLGLPEYRVEPGALEVRVSRELALPTSYRPFIRCAVVTLPAITETSLVAIMKLQESLHWGIGRDRKLASIGVYDLDTVEGPIDYRTLDPERDRFVPLGMPGTSMSGRQILEEHPKGIAYAHLLKELERYPLLVDARGQVLSMPPVINSEETKLGVGSERIFVDVTGPSEAAVVKSLDTLVCSLIELGGRVESVSIHTADGVLTSPDLAPRRMTIDLEAARDWLGIPLDAGSLTHSLRRMRFDVEPSAQSEGRFEVLYPAFRTDVKHMVDLFEDLAIGYGYANIAPRLVPTMTVGQARPEADLSITVRSALLGLGFSEIMSLPLATEEDHFRRFRLPVPGAYARVGNPKMKALTVVRSHLLTGLLQALHANRRRPLPLSLFELDDAVALDEETETGVREERRLAFVEMGRDTGYASVRSVLDAVLRELGLVGTFEPEDHPCFLDGRCARVCTPGAVHGVLGELHPEVITGFRLDHPVAAADLCLARVV